MIQMEARIVPALVMSYPLAIGMNMGRVGMAFRVFETAGRRGMLFLMGGRGVFLLPRRRGGMFHGGRSMRRSITTANVLLPSFMVFLVLRVNSGCAHQKHS
jgi:hypothetical protein